MKKPETVTRRSGGNKKVSYILFIFYIFWQIVLVTHFVTLVYSDKTKKPYLLTCRVSKYCFARHHSWHPLSHRNFKFKTSWGAFNATFCSSFFTRPNTGHRTRPSALDSNLACVISAIASLFQSARLGWCDLCLFKASSVFTWLGYPVQCSCNHHQAKTRLWSDVGLM